MVVAPNVQIALTRFSSPLEAERRKKLQYKMNRVSIDAECRHINADKEYKRKIAQALEKCGLDEDYYEFDYLRKLEDQILRYIFTEYMQKNRDFEYYLEQEGCKPETVMTDIEKDGQLNIWKLYDKYQNIWRYFDDWIVIKTNEDDTEIVGIVVRKREDIHVETCNW